MLGWLWGLLLMWCSVGQANTLTILSAEQESQPIQPILEIFEDGTRQLTLADMLSPAYTEQFQSFAGRRVSFGRTESAIWARFQLQRRDTQTWYLLLDALIGGELDLYLLDADNQPVSVKRVEKWAFYRRPLWELQLPQDETFQVYIRATNCGVLLNLPLQVLTAEQLLTTSIANYRFYSGVYVTIVVLMFYNLLLFKILRDKLYLFLAIYTSSIGISLHKTNPVFESLYFLGDTQSPFFLTSFYISSVMLLLLSREVLQLRHHLPSMDKLVLVVVGLGALLAVFAGFLPLDNGFASVFGVSILGLIIITILEVIQRGDRIARYFLIVFLIMMGVFLPALFVLAFFPEYWNARYIAYVAIGHLLFIVLLSTIQAERMRCLREQVQHTQIISRARRDFVANISHELRTPLNAISGLGALLRLTPLNPEQTDYVDKLERSSQHVSQLIGNVLDMARIEQHTLELNEEVFSLAELVEEVYGLLEHKATHKYIYLHYKLAADLPALVTGDRLRLAQVLRNLLENAIRYTEQGEVRLEVSSSHTTSEIAHVTFGVRDTGIGISLQQQEQVFSAFEQLHQHSNMPREGIGLGLAITRSLVKMMGGKLSLSSEQGMGSHFYFTLPFHVSSTLPESEVDQLPQGIRVLLVDDDELNLFVGKQLLQYLGAEVGLAENGCSGIAMLQQEKFDVVLLDISMPDMSGLDVLAWIRQESAVSAIPVLVLTAHATAEVEQQCRLAGANGFLAKPFVAPALCEAINQQLA